MVKTAVVGATGPTGIHLVTELRKTVATVRVIARSVDKLVRLFPEAAVEKWEADIRDRRRDPARNRRLRPRIRLHRLAWRSDGTCIRWPHEALPTRSATPRRAACRCQYWAYYPQVRTEMNEDHPRGGGPPWVRYRREAEDVLRDAGAAILHLPDFYGPYVHVSTLQNALNEAASGKTVNWLGRPGVQREYVYVPDAMRIAVEIGARYEALGEHWCLPSSGPLSGWQVVDIAGRHFGRQVKLRAAGITTLRIVSLFNKDLRGLLQVAPDYMKPVNYDSRKLQSLLGPQQMTSYNDGIGRTLAWIASR
jgi:nucleoside-diphosphate-sugar epimerase